MFTEEFGKMKDEVPPALIDTHIKSVETAVKEGKEVTDQYGLDKSGIAGTGADKEQDSKGRLYMSIIYSGGLVYSVSWTCNIVLQAKMWKTSQTNPHQYW